jgi:hypothetical protein
MTITTCPKCGVRYCSKACQKADWNKHKTECETYRKNRYTKKVTKMLTEKKYIASCYWKGTACPMVLNSKELFNHFVEGSQFLVDNQGASSSYTKQMNIMEKKLVDAYETTGVRKDTLSKEEQRMWWFYVGALIILGAINQDNNFGYLEQEINDDETLIITL